MSHSLFDWFVPVCPSLHSKKLDSKASGFLTLKQSDKDFPRIGAFGAYTFDSIAYI